MKRIALIACAVLLFSNCINTGSNEVGKDKNNTENNEKKDSVANLKDVALSFKGIEIGKNIDSIKNSCFKSDAKISFERFELMSDFVCSAMEKEERTFYTSIIAGNDNNTYTGKVLVYTEKGEKRISKIVFYTHLDSDKTYSDICGLYEGRYGKPTTQKTSQDDPFEIGITTWIFANNRRLDIAKREYVGPSYGYQEIERIGKAFSCVEIIYCDYSVQIRENKIKEEAKKKAAEEQKKKDELKKKQKETQDI